ncbi:MAG: PKD domain-containing protein [Cyclobacteriaceae bacterium]
MRLIVCMICLFLFRGEVYAGGAGDLIDTERTEISKELETVSSVPVRTVDFDFDQTSGLTQTKTVVLSSPDIIVDGSGSPVVPPNSYSFNIIGEVTGFVTQILPSTNNSNKHEIFVRVDVESNPSATPREKSFSMEVSDSSNPTVVLYLVNITVKQDVPPCSGDQQVFLNVVSAVCEGSIVTLGHLFGSGTGSVFLNYERWISATSSYETLLSNNVAILEATQFRAKYRDGCGVVKYSTPVTVAIDPLCPEASFPSSCLPFGESTSLNVLETETGTTISLSQRRFEDPTFTEFYSGQSTSLVITNDEISPFQTGRRHYFEVIAMEPDGRQYKFYRSIYFEEPLEPDFSFSEDTYCTDFTPLVYTDDCEIEGYIWDFGDGNTSTSKNPSHQYTARGTYDVELKVRYRCQCTEESVVAISHPVDFQFDSPEIDFVSTNSLCTTVFCPEVSYPDAICTTRAIEWDFGDTNTSTLHSPVHKYENLGTHTATMSLTYNCGCGDELRVVTHDITFSEEISIPDPVISPTQPITGVLSASAVTFTNSWFLDIIDINRLGSQALKNGMTGPWRIKESYIYETDRNATVNSVDTREDGTFTLNTFNWNNGKEGDIDNWLLANEITDYDDFSHETENVDVLGRHSSAIYGYNGQVVKAVIQNASNKEVGFTSFEDVGTEIEEGAGDPSSGNWWITDGFAMTYMSYEIEEGHSNQALVNAESINFEDLPISAVVWKERIYSNLGLYNLLQPGQGFGRLFSGIAEKVNIVCASPHPQDDSKTFLAFDEIIQKEGSYEGRLAIFQEGIEAENSFVSTAHAHTGVQSLAVNDQVSLSQGKIVLEPGKSYWLSAWVTNDTKAINTQGILDGNISLEVEFYVDDDATDPEFSTNFAPSGPVINGWQQISGQVNVPETLGSDSYWNVILGSGDLNFAYFDDLRILPMDAQMRSFVYEQDTYRLRAILDENNFASYYYYDEKGELYLVKKETERGIRTIQEVMSHQSKRYEEIGDYSDLH